jgi:hypothetical protein
MVLFAISVTTVTLTVSAQSPAPELFVDLAATGLSVALEHAGGASSAIVQRRAVGMRLDRLFAASDAPNSVPSGPAARVQLNVDNHGWIAQLERLEYDTTGFRSWVGSIDGVEFSHVVFTERDGIVSGLIDAGTATYQLRTNRAGVYLLERVDTTLLRDEADPLLSSAGATAPRADLPAASSGAGEGAASVVAGDDGRTIDVLMLYTPSARAASGGAAQIQAMASQIIADSNRIYVLSGISPRLRLAATAELSLTEASDLSSTLRAVTFSAAAGALRDSARADVVQLLVNSPDSSSCGVGWLLDSLSDTQFTPYSVADIGCIAQYTPTHEIGHNLGAHHAPEDGAAGALFSYSYGYKDPTRGFRTVMAYACPTSGPRCARIPNFSNPAVSHNGATTGGSIQNNALTINNAAFTAANWRQTGSAPAPSPTPPPTPAPTPPAPSTPTGLRAAVSNNTVTLGWNHVSSASTYTLQVGTRPGTYNVFNAAVGNINTISGNVQPGTYFWRVSAANSAGASAPSSESSFTVGGTTCLAPGPPQNFTFVVSGRTVTLNWLPPATGTAAISYVIEAGSASGLANLYNAATGNPVPGAVGQVPPGMYFVRIRAQNGCGLSAPSPERVITVP